jgi:uncharacterized surface protein with fasciclin (FAS1) repeats
MHFRLTLVALLCVGACSKQAPGPVATANAAAPLAADKRDTPPPPLDPNNIVSIASASKDHTTLVRALQAADYVRSVANPGPLTVFAPTDAAFAKLPAATLAALLEPAQQADLRDILKYHVAAAVYEEPALKAMDGKQLGMANGKKVTIKVKDGKVMINDALVVASIRASNGVVHVVDGVLLPPNQ